MGGINTTSIYLTPRRKIKDNESILSNTSTSSTYSRLSITTLSPTPLLQDMEFCYECDKVYVLFAMFHCKKCNKCHNKYKNIYCIHCNTCLDHSSQNDIITHRKNCILLL